jgi:hypothetical protein
MAFSCAILHTWLTEQGLEAGSKPLEWSPAIESERLQSMSNPNCCVS